MKINNSNPRTAKGVNGTKEDRKVFESTFKDSGSNDVQTKDLTSYKSAVESAEAKVTSAEQNLASAQAIRDNTSPTIEKQFQIGVDENNNPIYETRQEPNPDYKAAQDAVAAAEGELSTAKEEKTQAEAEQTKAQEEYEKAEKENEETQEALNTAKDEISAESDSEFDEYTQCSYSTEEEFYLPQENDNQYSASIHIFADIINDADKENFYEILNNESLTSEDWANIIQDYNQNYANRNKNKTFVNALYTNLSKTTEKSELNNIMDTVAMKLTEAADNDNPIAQDAIREMDSNGYINLASNTDISELKEIAEEIPQLDIEQYSSPEDQNKAWAINDLINTLNSSMNNILEQDKEDGAISDGYNFIKEITGCGVSIEDIKKAIVSQKETVQKLTDALNGKGEKSFEETYKELTGTTYDDQKIIEYKDAEINYNMAYKSLNNAYSLCDLVKNCNSYDDLLETYKNFYGSEEEARKEISDILLDGYKAAHAESVEIDENNKIHIKYRDGKEQDYDSLTQEQLSLIYITIDSNKTEYQNKYSQVELEAIENYFGKSYEEIQKDYVEKENNALGNANAIEQTVNKYCEDQDGFIDNIAHKTQLAGMCLLVGGAVVSFVCPPAGAAMGAAMMSVGKGLSFGGMFGNQVAKIINNGTSEKGITKEDVSGLLKETVQELSYIALGCGINHIAETLQVQSFDGLIEMGVSEKTATVLSWLVEGGTDMALSIMSDLVITGDANFNGNSMQVLMGILTGVANAKANSYRADMAADSKIKDIRSELGDISESDANAEVLRRFGYNDSEIAEMASKPSAEVDKAIIRERKIRAYSNVLEEQGVDTSKMSAQEKLSKGAIADGLLKNIDNVKQEGDDGSCAIAAVLNGIVGKGKNAIDRLSQKFTYDEASGKYSCAELGIEGIEVDIAGGENAALKIYEAFKASNPDLSEGTCVTKVLNVLMDGGSDIIAKFDGNIESIKNYANDSDTILTLNTEKGVDVQSADGKITTIKEGHAYTVSGYNSATGELILIDPQNPNSVIKIQESDFNKLIESDAQIEGKTYADGDSGIVDTEARIVGGTNTDNTQWSPEEINTKLQDMANEGKIDSSEVENIQNKIIELQNAGAEVEKLINSPTALDLIAKNPTSMKVEGNTITISGENLPNFGGNGSSCFKIDTTKDTVSIVYSTNCINIGGKNVEFGKTVDIAYNKYGNLEPRSIFDSKTFEADLEKDTNDPYSRIYRAEKESALEKINSIDNKDKRNLLNAIINNPKKFDKAADAQARLELINRIATGEYEPGGITGILDENGNQTDNFIKNLAKIPTKINKVGVIAETTVPKTNIAFKEEVTVGNEHYYNYYDNEGRLRIRQSVETGNYIVNTDKGGFIAYDSKGKILEFAANVDTGTKEVTSVDEKGNVKETKSRHGSGGGPDRSYTIEPTNISTDNSPNKASKLTQEILTTMNNPEDGLYKDLTEIIAKCTTQQDAAKKIAKYLNDINFNKKTKDQLKQLTSEGGIVLDCGTDKKGNGYFSINGADGIDENLKTSMSQSMNQYYGNCSESYLKTIAGDKLSSCDIFDLKIRYNPETDKFEIAEWPPCSTCRQNFILWGWEYAQSEAPDKRNSQQKWYSGE